MRKHCAYFIFTIFILLLRLPGEVYAQSPTITNGLNWLNLVQSPEGNWGSNTSATDFVPATVAALESLTILNSTATPNYTNAANWLTAQQIDTTRYLSERLLIFPAANADKDAILSYLDELSRAWGGYSRFIVNNLDTALAIQALKATNYSDSTVLYQAINFLTTNQNPDGGWGFRPATNAEPADPSNAYVTAHVQRALAAYNSTFQIQDPINKAKAYLLTKQNDDGGFGSSPSNVYETALSLMTLVESGQSNLLPLQNALNYLTTAQSSNGSWNDDPYSTALALQALAKAQANLSVSSISFSKSLPQAGEAVTITAAVHNSGLEAAASVVVRFYQGDPANGGTQIGVDQIIPFVDSSSESGVSITTSFNETGSKTILVVVDPTTRSPKPPKQTTNPPAASLSQPALILPSILKI